MYRNEIGQHHLHHCLEFHPAPIIMSKPLSIPRGPLIVMALTVSCTLGAILYAHYEPKASKRVMREGVERDKERLRKKKQQQEATQSQ